MMDLGGFSMFDLFQTEVRQHASTLANGLIALEQHADNPKLVEPLMRAAHSIKGAARIINLDVAVQLAHAMEECLIRVQTGKERPTPQRIDQLLSATDTLAAIADRTSEEEARAWLEEVRDRVAAAAASFRQPAEGVASPRPAPSAELTATSAATPAHYPEQTPAPEASSASSPAVSPSTPSTSRESGVLLSSRSLDRILELSGEALVEARRLESIKRTLSRARVSQRRLADAIALIDGAHPGPSGLASAADATHRALSDAVDLVEEHLRRGETLANALHNEAVASRMRPFGDACAALPRTVRDLARTLGKDVRLVVQGEQVPVDREILRQLEAPLGHLVRNALDHGVEPAEVRRARGKPAQATLRVEARHHAGGLLVEVRDDGSGINRDSLRSRIVAKGLAQESIAAALSDDELFDFLFLPGFSTASTVTEISGRGVGLDVVQTMAHGVGGAVTVRSDASGTSFALRLPVTLSVVRAAVVTIAGETYALPLARLERIDRIDKSCVQSVHGRPTCEIRGEAVGLLSSTEILGLQAAAGSATDDDSISVVSVLAGTKPVGFIVDSFLGEEDLVVRKLDARLGDVAHVDAASIRENGELLVILDVEDMIQSAQQLLREGRLRGGATQTQDNRAQRRILVVEDSITVREVERQMLLRAGYAVDTAVDGIDGWNAVQRGSYDLIVSDIDMPRMNGIDLTRRIRADARFARVPIVIVSYKDREEDRLAGMEAGASTYLTKGAFHDRTFLDTVADLLVEPAP
jgi:two-component system sensor histidine kinase and response regulator WspE